MGEKGSKNEVHYLTLFPPLSPTELQVLIDQYIEANEEKLGKGKEGEDGLSIAARVMDTMKIRLALVSANRLKAYDRQDAKTESRKWLLEELGLTIKEAAEFDFSDGTSEEIQRRMIAMSEAADIIGALVPEKCEGWSPPEDLEDWPELPDWLFQPARAEALRLNPQWAILAGFDLGNIAPGSQSNGQSGTTD